MELAAIATAAVPGLAPTGVATLPDDGNDFDSVLIVDASGNRWRVRSPLHEDASMRLETELAALRAFSAGIRASLPFALPSVAGTVRQGPLRTFVYNHLPGRQYSLEDLVGLGSRCAKDLGAVMAAIHSMPSSAIDRADLPAYTAEQVRQRRLNELDAAATTGMIPSRLLRRWEHALEDVALWRFNATAIHGDLHEDQLLIAEAKVVAVNGWTDLQVGDPADDFAWLAAVHEQSFAEAAFESYVAVRGDRADPHIMRRAALAAEFALAQWLVKAIAGGDPERIAEAKVMLEELDSDIAEFGGQPISVVEPPRAPRPEPEATPAAAPKVSPATPVASAVPSAARNDEDDDRSQDDASTPDPVEAETSAMKLVPAPVSATSRPPATPPAPAKAPVKPAEAPKRATPSPAKPTKPEEAPKPAAPSPSKPTKPTKPEEAAKSPGTADPDASKKAGAAEPETNAIPIQKLDPQ